MKHTGRQAKRTRQRKTERTRHAYSNKETIEWDTQRIICGIERDERRWGKDQSRTPSADQRKADSPSGPQSPKLLSSDLAKDANNQETKRTSSSHRSITDQSNRHRRVVYNKGIVTNWTKINYSSHTKPLSSPLPSASFDKVLLMTGMCYYAKLIAIKYY